MFPCAACKAKDDEIKHLRALVDSILMGKGLAPVATPGSAQEDAELDIPEKIEDQPLIKQYGGE